MYCFRPGLLLRRLGRQLPGMFLSRWNGAEPFFSQDMYTCHGYIACNHHNGIGRMVEGIEKGFYIRHGSTGNVITLSSDGGPAIRMCLKGQRTSLMPGIDECVHRGTRLEFFNNTIDWKRDG